MQAWKTICHHTVHCNGTARIECRSIKEQINFRRITPHFNCNGAVSVSTQFVTSYNELVHTINSPNINLLHSNIDALLLRFIYTVPDQFITLLVMPIEFSFFLQSRGAFVVLFACLTELKSLSLLSGGQVTYAVLHWGKFWGLSLIC